MRILKAQVPGALFIVLVCLFLAACGASKKNSGSSSAYETGPASRALQQKFSTLMGVSPQKITNGKLYNFIDKWLNTKYKYGSQNDKEIDCSGFTQILYDAVYQLKLPRNSQAQFDAAASKVQNAKNLEEGDLVFFALGSGKKITHVGVYLQNNRFVNATTRGVLISDMNLPYWKQGFAGGAALRDFKF